MKHADILCGIDSDSSGFITLKTTQTQTRIWFMGDGIVRIRTSFSGHFPEQSLSLVWTAWEDLYDQLLGTERHRTVPLVPTVDDRDNNQLILTCDLEKIREDGYKTTVITAVTNSADFEKVEPVEAEHIHAGEKLLDILV